MNVSISKHGNLVGKKTPEEELLIELLSNKHEMHQLQSSFRQEWRPDSMGPEEAGHFENYHGRTQRDDI